MNKIFLLPLVFLTITAAKAQELYQPRNIKTAYEKGTRAADGNPGRNYWQNHAQYDMDIQVEPATRIVRGKETISYSNNSPDTLKVLVIRFVNNVHKPGAIRGADAQADFLTTGLVIHSLVVDGEEYTGDAKNWGTIGSVQLKKPLLPGSSASLLIDWEYPLSEQSDREGQIDSATFFVAYSYPRISVYDDYNGWDILPHNGRQEFYNDFNDYSFRVSVPANYVVWATGDLLNPEEVLQPEITSRLKESYTSDEIIHVATAAEMKAGKVTLPNDRNTWKFTASHVTDVCFALSNHYVWDASSVVVDDKTGRRASTQAAYDENGTDFINSVKYSSYALAWYSSHWPGISYPFSKMTAFQGFADMEYPMMVNDSNTGNDFLGRFVQDHEIAHTYFPFYMGINETRYAYMDEGWATALEYLIGGSYNDQKSTDENFRNFRVKKWINDPAAEEDQPIITMSSQLSGVGYGNNAYGKAALAYLALKDLLGDDLFKKSLHRYMEAWNGKHPIPWDFFNAMNTGSGQDLNWFWQNWFFTNHYIDLAVIGLNGQTVSIQNTGGFAIPFDLIIHYEDGSQQVEHQLPSVWRTDPRRTVIPVKGNKAIQSVELNGGIFMDATPANNSWKK